jgi:arylsulfatase A-like enzyme
MDDGPWRAKNVIWIFGDQHRAQTLGYAGDPNVHTPHLDRMAAEGVVMNGVSGCPLCCPYRGSLLSGRYVHEAVPGHEKQLDPALPTVATAFNDAGFHTAYFGKWHVDGHHERDLRGAFHIVPRERRGGFDTWVGYENNNAQYDCHVHGHDNEDEVEHYKLPNYETEALSDLFIEHIERRNQAGGRFFAALSVQPPHDPYVAPPEFARQHNAADVQLRPNVPAIPWVEKRARRELAGYHAMIEDLDHHVGRIRAKLTQLGLLEDTVIVFFSDHGDLHGSHGQFKKTSPLEESIRVPMIVSAGADLYEHQRAHRPNVLVNHVDLIPTSLGLCGLEVPDWCRGTDLSGHFIKEKSADVPDSAFLQFVEPTGHGHSVGRPWRGIVTSDGWKYACFKNQPWLMFDLNEDPHEQANRAHDPAFLQKRQQLHDRLRQWIDETRDTFALAADSA